MADVLDPQSTPPVTPEGATPPATGTEQTTPPEGAKKPDEQSIPYERFKAKVDEANELKEKVAAFEKAQEEARIAGLTELEQEREKAKLLQAQLDAQKADVLSAKKQALLAKAGYSDEQIGRYAKFLTGETDDELNAALDELKADVPPKVEKTYADPSSKGAGQRQTPEKKDLHDKGTSAYQRLKAAGRIGRKQN